MDGGCAMTTLTLDEFLPHIGASFPLLDRSPAALMLATADAVAAPNAPGDRRTAFVLTFRSADPTNWGQDLYQIGHPTSGAMEIFMVPIAGDRHGITYEAVFN
jgi:hypothetical protein